MEVKYIEETRDLIGEAIGKLMEQEQRTTVLKMLGDYVKFLDAVQAVPMREWLAYYEGAFRVYDYLRRNRQLGRRVGMFDREVKEVIEGILSKYLYDNGL